MEEEKELSNIEGIVRFHIQRRMTNQTRKALSILESLLNNGFNFDFKTDRKILLDELNDGLREIEKLLDLVDIYPKKK